MKKLTSQEIFNKVKRHLLRQGAKAQEPVRTVPGSGCMYHAPDGKRCAIGCLIPKRFYLPEMEGNNVTSLYDKLGGVFALVGIDYPKSALLLFDLQAVHDKREVFEWPEALREVAVSHSLTYGEEK